MVLRGERSRAKIPTTLVRRLISMLAASSDRKRNGVDQQHFNWRHAARLRPREPVELVGDFVPAVVEAGVGWADTSQRCGHHLGLPWGASPAGSGHMGLAPLPRPAFERLRDHRRNPCVGVADHPRRVSLGRSSRAQEGSRDAHLPGGWAPTPATSSLGGTSLLLPGPAPCGGLRHRWPDGAG